MKIDEAIKTIIGYCDKHTQCFETDNTPDMNITTKCKFYNADWDDCILKQCPADWIREELLLRGEE